MKGRGTKCRQFHWPHKFFSQRNAGQIRPLKEEGKVSEFWWFSKIKLLFFSIHIVLAFSHRFPVNPTSHPSSVATLHKGKLAMGRVCMCHKFMQPSSLESQNHVSVSAEEFLSLLCFNPQHLCFGFHNLTP